MKLIRVGVDLAKNVFQLHGVDRDERPVWRRRLSRAEWLKALQETLEPGCEIGMEACAGSHHWARLLEAKGYWVKLIAPQFVKPYVKSNKNDANDAEAIPMSPPWLWPIKQFGLLGRCSLVKVTTKSTTWQPDAI